MWLLTIPAIGGMIFTALLARQQYRSWLSPSAVFNSYWAVLLIAHIIIVPDFDFRPSAAWIILLFGLTLHVGSHLGWDEGIVRAINAGKSGTPRIHRMRWVVVALILCTLLGLFAVPPLLHSRGYSLFDLLRPDIVVQMGRDFSIARYQDRYVPPEATRMFITFVHLGGLFSGVWLAMARTRLSRLLAFLPFLPAGLVALIQTTRASLLFPFILCVGSYGATLVFTQTRVQVRFSHLFIVGVLLLTLFGAYLGLQILRDRLTAETISVAVEKAKVAFFGSPAVFSQWLESEWLRQATPAWGALTLAGIFDQLGIAERQQGLYTEFVALGAEGRTSNIYTIFRGLIQDFTLPGALIIWLILAVVAGVSYRKVIAGNAYWLPVLTIFYSLVIGGYLTSLLTYNTVVVAWLIFQVLWSLMNMLVLRRPSAHRFRLMGSGQSIGVTSGIIKNNFGPTG